jgi:hypothetical protein
LGQSVRGKREPKKGLATTNTRRVILSDLFTTSPSILHDKPHDCEFTRYYCTPCIIPKSITMTIRDAAAWSAYLNLRSDDCPIIATPDRMLCDWPIPLGTPAERMPSNHYPCLKPICDPTNMTGRVYQATRCTDRSKIRSHFSTPRHFVDRRGDALNVG